MQGPTLSVHLRVFTYAASADVELVFGAHVTLSADQVTAARTLSCPIVTLQGQRALGVTATC